MARIPYTKPLYPIDKSPLGLRLNYEEIELRVLADLRRQAIEHLQSRGETISVEDAEKLLMQFQCNFPELKKWIEIHTSQELQNRIQQMKGGG